MELIVRQGEQEHRVRVNRNGDRYQVAVGDRAYQVDSATIGDGVLSLLIDGGQYEVAVQRQEEGHYWVNTGEGAALVEVMDPLTHLALEARGGKAKGGPQEVRALMPGRVVAVLVEEGAQVTAGQGIVVLEAMKMENEIQAEHDGVVRTILVEPGQAVEGGDPLFELE